MEDHCRLQKEDIEGVVVDLQTKRLALAAEPAGMMEEAFAMEPALHMTVGASVRLA